MTFDLFSEIARVNAAYLSALGINQQEKNVPVYKITSKLAPEGVTPVVVTQLVQAPNQASAVRHVAAGIITATVADAAECITLGSKGVRLENANGADS